MNRVFLDMDGVLADFDRLKTELEMTGEQLKCMPDAFDRMQPIAGAIAGVRSLIGMGFECWIATKPPTGIPHAYADKAKWIIRHLPELQRRIVMTHNKGFLGDEKDFLVDDRPHKANCEQFRGILIPFVDGMDWPTLINVFRGYQACDNYSRPPGVMGGPCLHCGRSQPEHVHRKPLVAERMLVSGKPVPSDGSHTQLKPNGQQQDYVVLSPEERAKGFVKPLRHSYIHAFPSETDRQVGCGGETRMGQAIAETYARNPRFYNGTFCVHCKKHFPLNQFIWDGGGELNGEPMDPDLQDAWLVETRARREREKEERRQRRIAELTSELAQLHAEASEGKTVTQSTEEK